MLLMFCHSFVEFSFILRVNLIDFFGKLDVSLVAFDTLFLLVVVMEQRLRVVLLDVLGA